MNCHYIREQRHICGPEYMEVDIYPITVREHKASTRAKKKKASDMVRCNLNSENAKRHLRQLVNTNFTWRDLHVTLTYDSEHLPKTEEEAERNFRNWLERVARRCKKLGLPPPKYIGVTEHQEPGPGRKGVRYHHHAILSCGLNRDELESLWHAGRGRKRFERMGTANADRLQLDKGSLEALCNYLLKYPNRKRRWTQSRGLKQPERPRPNDTRYTKRKVERIVRGEVYDPDFWHRQYPGYELAEARPVYRENTGWSIYLQMWRPDNRPPGKLWRN